MDDRTKRVNLVGEAAYQAATEAMDKILKEAALTPEEATSILATGLLWPAVNYLMTLGANKQELLHVVSEMHDSLEEEETAALN